MEKEGRLSGSGFGVQGSRLARRAARPLIMDESFARIRNAKLEMRNGGGGSAANTYFAAKLPPQP